MVRSPDSSTEGQVNTSLLQPWRFGRETICVELAPSTRLFGGYTRQFECRLRECFLFAVTVRQPVFAHQRSDSRIDLSVEPRSSRQVLDRLVERGKLMIVRVTHK